MEWVDKGVNKKPKTSLHNTASAHVGQERAGLTGGMRVRVEQSSSDCNYGGIYKSLPLCIHEKSASGTQLQQSTWMNQGNAVNH